MESFQNARSKWNEKRGLEKTSAQVVEPLR